MWVCRVCSPTFTCSPMLLNWHLLREGAHKWFAIERALACLLVLITRDKDTEVQTMPGMLIGRRQPQMLSVILLGRLQQFFGLVLFSWPSALHSLVALGFGSPVCLSFQSPTLLFPEPSELLPIPMQWDCIVSFATWYTFFFIFKAQLLELVDYVRIPAFIKKEGEKNI